MAQPRLKARILRSLVSAQRFYGTHKFDPNPMNSFNLFLASITKPISFATPTEAIAELVIGVLLLLTCGYIAWHGNRSHDYERQWTNRRLQITGVFGTVSILLAFLRYEGIPYASMQVVLGLIVLWAVLSFVQLVLYRQLVLKPARVEWREHKERDQYLPKPKARSAR